MKDILACANNALQELPRADFSRGTFNPSHYEGNTPKRHTVRYNFRRSLGTSAIQSRLSRSQEDSNSDEAVDLSSSANIDSSVDLFPTSYEELSRDELVSLLCSVEIKYRRMEEELNELRIRPNPSEQNAHNGTTPRKTTW